ncbi:MAG: GGDEF domain-containing protein [Proteobacteria bacterium]|nr:GGDEF domain-containing protein [Pseudomonadota bacterium]
MISKEDSSPSSTVNISSAQSFLRSLSCYRVQIHFLAESGVKDALFHGFFRGISSEIHRESVKVNHQLDWRLYYAELNYASSMSSTDNLLQAIRLYLSQYQDSTAVVVLVISDQLLGDGVTKEDIKAIKELSQQPLMILYAESLSIHLMDKVSEWVVSGMCDAQESPYGFLWKIQQAIVTREWQHQLSLREQHVEHLYQLSMYDELTGLYNMRYFHQCLQKHIAAATRYDIQLALIMLDIDHFKKVNDHISHLAGSHILTLIGEIIAKNIRYHDTAARFGGDEFIIILPHTNRGGAQAVAWRIMAAIAQKVFVIEQYSVHISVSAGVALSTDQRQLRSSKERSEISQEFIKKADQYLYQAKDNGRGRLSLQGQIILPTDSQGIAYSLTSIQEQESSSP